MNKLLLSLALALGVVTSTYAAPEPKQEKVCIKTTEKGKEIEKCRMVKKHEKLEKVEPTPSK